MPCNRINKPLYSGLKRNLMKSIITLRKRLHYLDIFTPKMQFFSISIMLCDK